MPDLLHIVPVLNDSMLDRILNSKDSTLLLGLLADVDLLLVKANHDAGHLGATHDS